MYPEKIFSFPENNQDEEWTNGISHVQKHFCRVEKFRELFFPILFPAVRQLLNFPFFSEHFSHGFGIFLKMMQDNLRNFSIQEKSGQSFPVQLKNGDNVCSLNYRKLCALYFRNNLLQ